MGSVGGPKVLGESSGGTGESSGCPGESSGGPGMLGVGFTSDSENDRGFSSNEESELMLTRPRTSSMIGL